MSESTEKAFFVRRRDKSFGPFTAKQILSGKAANKFQETDLISESADGPWISMVQHFAAASQRPPVNAVPPPVVQGANLEAAPKIIDSQLVQKTDTKPSSPWKYVVVGILGICAVGFVGVVGLTILFIVAAFAFSGGDKSSATSSAEVIGVDSAPGDDASGADGLAKAMGDLQSALDGLKEGAESAGQEGAPGSSETVASDYSELSEEQRALSPKEATELAMKYLSPAEREVNGKTALLLLQKASEEGDGGAMYFLFLCYYKGWGTSEDQAKGLEWLQKSAEAGDPTGMFAYSGAICKGLVEGKSESEGMMWLNRSAQVGHQPAIVELKRLQVNGAVAAFGALLENEATDEGTESPTHACDFYAGNPFVPTCPCNGFEPGGLRDNPDPLTCRLCLHPKGDHFR
jgi:hypothetical protein